MRRAIIIEEAETMDLIEAVDCKIKFLREMLADHRKEFGTDNDAPGTYLRKRLGDFITLKTNLERVRAR